MRVRHYPPRFTLLLVVGLLGFALAAIPAFAQSTITESTSTSLRSSWTPGTGLVLDVASPAFASAQAGNVTFYGAAANCDSGEPASRVAIYDGTDESASYVADVAFDTPLNLGAVCMGKSGTAPVGFTLIFDSHLLPDGPHSLS